MQSMSEFTVFYDYNISQYMYFDNFIIFSRKEENFLEILHRDFFSVGTKIIFCTLKDHTCMFVMGKPVLAICFPAVRSAPLLFAAWIV